MKLPISPNSIKGFLDEDEGRALYLNALNSSEFGPIVEIGSYCGKSALYLGSAVKKNNQKLYSIDHHEGSEEQQIGQEYFDPDLFDKSKGKINTLPFFLNTIKEAKLEGTVIPIVSTSHKASLDWNEQLSMVFIDGGHSMQVAIQDFNDWNNKIKIGGILAIHDIFPNPKDGGRPPYEIYLKALKSNKFEEIEMVKTLGILKKIK